MENAIKKEERKVEYSELIYDLIFVYIIGRNNSLLHDVSGGFVAPAMFLAYILCTLAVIQIWNFTTFYINMYGRNGLRDHVFMFINMYLLYFMAEGTRVHWQEYRVQNHAAWAAILINIGMQYLIEYRNHKNSESEKGIIKRMAFVLFGEAAIVLAAVPVYYITGAELALAAILFGIFVTMLSGRKNRTASVDFAHLSERAMLYVVFTFGEMIIAISSYFEGRTNFNTIYFSLMAFLIVVGLFLSYGTFYDNILDREMKTSGMGYMLIHVFLIFALNNITAALEFMHSEEVELWPKIIFLISSFLIYYAFLFMTGKYAKLKCRPSKAFCIKMLLTAISFVVIMLVLRNNMKLNIAVTVVYVFAVYLVMHWIGRVSKTK